MTPPTRLRPFFLALALLAFVPPPSLASFGNNGRKSVAKASPDVSIATTSTLPDIDVRGGGDSATTATATSAPILRPLTPADLAIAGALATMVGDAMLHPIDCVKTLQQSNDGAGLGLIGAASKIWADGGVGGFYSGLGTYIVADGGAGAVKFATYEAIKKWVSDRVPEQYVGAALFGCAAAAYMASSVILIPGELIKQRMQMGQASGFSAAVSSIWKNDGITGFFAGYQGVWLRDIPYTALELGIYDNVKNFFLKRRCNGEGEVTQTEEILAAGISGGITGYVTNPLDLIKTKLMVDGGAYGGFVDAFRKTMADGGLGALFHGGGARVGYILPFCAIYLPVYEIIKRKMERSEPKAKKLAADARGGAQAKAKAKAMRVKG
eukprot:CAMPEP_0183299012 /NCGR_PEP_ID=MMETSP0160_2-20130417/5850_1 /TAXON_ID=2839 ORGANISM="Odontella Sinensis, Strain Grunow 1884" /NCGR_SAMPLE_ID=MMETSP0160_2 /ASSEMBLY_ACC=CAM_ASM_000250 /LENGTH=380 /DNA_ID=CAMNT_0025461153 /DNA_START=59 /DNA_END=1198 /DNA_ORIENTATION=-